MPAILKRTMWAKSLGSIVSLAWFVAMIATGYYSGNEMLAWGILLWYPIVWAVVGLAGIMDEHPLLGKMGIWRGIVFWAMMNLVLVLFAAEPLKDLAMQGWFQASNSFLIFGGMLEWAIIWGIIDWVVTKKFGEGKKLMKK